MPPRERPLSEVRPRSALAAHLLGPMSGVAAPCLFGDHGFFENGPTLR